MTRSISCIALILFCHVAFAQNRALDSFIRATMRSEHIPGLSVAVMKGNKLLHSKGYGIADLEHQARASASTMFPIASITKSFTAIAIMTLVEEGKLSLNDNIGKYFPDLPETWKPVTLKQMLNHTSGISSFTSFDTIPCKVGKDVREYVRGDAWKEVACLPLQFKPGEDWSYSDTPYYLLGLLIEKISRQKYEDFVKARIFDPLGMRRSRLISYRELIPGRAEGYDHTAEGYRHAPRFEFEEFCIVSSVEDMVKMHTAFTTEKLLKRSTWQLMWTPTVVPSGKTIPQYGLGFGLTPYEGRKRIGHNGGGGLGYSTALAHFPDQALTVVLLTNLNLPTGRSGELANKIASMYLDPR